MLRQISISAIAVATCAGLAAAQNELNIASTLGSGPSTSASQGPLPTYTLDDGTADNGLGLTNGGEIGGLNQFQVVNDLNVIDSIEVTWGSAAQPGGSGLGGGEAFDVFVWQGSLTNPGGASLIGSASGAVDFGSIDNNVFQSVNLNAVVSGGNGTDFFIGVAIDHAPGTFPLALDQTASQGMSYAVGSGTPGGFDPNNLLGNDIAPVLLDDAGLPGNFMIRANAIPAPGSLALLGLAGLTGVRRRR